MIVYLIAENRQSAERLGRLHAAGIISAPDNGKRDAAIARWRRQPDRLRERYHVYGVEVHINHDVSLVVRTLRLALLAVIAGVILGGFIH